jgi:hypothetical protein
MGLECTSVLTLGEFASFQLARGRAGSTPVPLTLSGASYRPNEAGCKLARAGEEGEPLTPPSSPPNQEKEVRSMLNAKISRIQLGLILGMIGILAIGGWAMAQRFFGMGEYPGGTLKVVYELDDGDPATSPAIYTMEVTPDGDKYDIREVTESQDREADQVQLGFGAGGAAGAAGARYEEEDVEHIDMSPLSVLDDREVELNPNDQYLLPDGAMLKTGERDEIAGIEVVRAIYTHPNYPAQKTELALADIEASKLLPLPPLMIHYYKGEIDHQTTIIEFNHTK